jgi:myosin heavy subunit
MPSKQPLKNLFEEELVLEQLRLHRLTDIAIKSRTHYWEQISHELFASRYILFVPNEV